MYKVLVLNENTSFDAQRIYGDLLNSKDFKFVFYSKPVISIDEIYDNEFPDIVLTSLEWLPFQRLMISEARRRNIPTLYVMDGVIEWSYIWNNQSYVLPGGIMFQPLVSDYIAVIGHHPARILASIGLGEKINIIGLPRLNINKKRTVCIEKAKKKIGIFTANTPYHNSEQEYYVRKALSDLKDELKFLSEEVEIVWRINESLAESMGVANNKEDLENILLSLDCVISFHSTVILEAMLYNIPTALIEYRNVPIYIQTAWQIRSKNYIQLVIRELLYPSNEKMAYQAYCFNDELYLNGKNDNLKQLILLLINREFNNAYIKTNLRGAMDFHHINSQLGFFSIGENDKLRYEIDGYIKHNRNISKVLSDMYFVLSKNLIVRFFMKFKFLPLSKYLNNFIERLKYLSNTKIK